MNKYNLISQIKKIVSLIAPITTVAIVYIWFATSGTWTTWKSPTRYYANLALGFERGKLFSVSKPDPKLALLENPYDNNQRTGIEYPPDISYFNGKFYLYWGPVPAMLILPIQAKIGGRVGDLQITFAFNLATFLLLAFFLWYLRRKYFTHISDSIFGLSLAFTGLAFPFLYTIANFKGGRIHDAAIVGGQFFLFAGLISASLAFRGSTQNPSKINVIREYFLLFLAGLFWSLSIGSRLILIAPIALICIYLFFEWVWGCRESLNRTVLRSFFLGVPLLTGVSVLAWYNWARFGSIFESGLYYQLTGPDLQHNYKAMFQLGYFFQNLYNYFLFPIKIDPSFPYLAVEYGKTSSVLNFIELPEMYASQQIVGILPSIPFVVFSFFTLSDMSNHNTATSNSSGKNLWKAKGLLMTSVFFSAIPLMLFFWAATRYMMDFLPSLLVLAVIGYWQIFSLVNQYVRKALIVIGIIAMGVSIAFGVMLAFSANISMLPH